MTAPPTANVEPLAVSPHITSVLLNIGLSKTYELIRSGELETYLDGKNRKVTMRSIKARIARLLAANGPSAVVPPWHRGSKQTELSSKPYSTPATDSTEPPARRRKVEQHAPREALAFTVANGDLRGHADGVIIAGPALPGAYLIFPCVWECKALNARNWRALERDGLEKTFPKYAAQTALYQAYLNLTNPALFTAVNSDSCEPLHFLVPFNAERAQLWSDRAVTVIEATRAGELLPRGYDDPTDWHCRTCPHVERCWR
jgi:hypothetical protein